jgi:hypothetical protein
LEKGTFWVIWTPLSIEASEQLDQLQHLLELIQVNPTEADHWTYIWNSGEYISQKAYLQIIGLADASPIFKWMWKSCARGKHKFFFWLLLHGRLNTRELLRMKNMDLQDHSCVRNVDQKQKTIWIKNF